MPAPTALLRAPEQLAEEAEMPIFEAGSDDDTPILDANALPSDVLEAIIPEPSDEAVMELDSGRPTFAPAKDSGAAVRAEMRKISIPPHRRTALKRSWREIYSPLVEFLLLQVKYDPKARAVYLRTSKSTSDSGALQKGEDFLRAFTLGFDLEDAIALLRLDDLYIQSFEIKDVKNLQGDHLSRCIGRISGKDGKTKFAIENASKTRVVLADQKIHILGGFQNIGIAREAIVSLILGAPPGKVYGNLRTVASRMKERF